MNAVPPIRFKGFTDPWEQRKHVVRLADVCDFITKGATPTTYGFEWQDSGIPFFRNDAIKDNRFVYGDFSYISEEANQMIGRSEIRANDILIAITGEIGKVGIVPAGIERGNINQHIARVRVIRDYDPYFVYTYLCTHRLQQSFQLIKTGLSMPQLSLTQIRAIELPSIDMQEQRRISTEFTSLDSLITLHQRKYDQLAVLKKALLEKMFPRDGASEPEIRFAGFTDPWEQREFSDVFDFMRNNTLSRVELSESKGSVLDVHYGDVLIKFGEVLDASFEHLPRIADSSLAEQLSCPHLADGDVIIADTAEDEAVGKCSELRGCGDKKIVSGLHTMACRPQFEFAPGYLGYYLNSPAFHEQLLPLMQGIKVVSVSKAAISDTDVRFPLLSEQRAIGSSLLSLDRLITLHQRKLEALRNLKSSLLAKMFV